jgi:hypothetical protein
MGRGRDHQRSRCARFRRVLLWTLVACLGPAGTAHAISAPIHIHGTGTDGVLIRSAPNTSATRLGWMGEGTSPDYHCFTYGESIHGVNVWFNVTHAGITGYYASYYDDSSYHSEAELTSKYGVPKCGSGNPQPPDQPPPSRPPPGPPPTTPPPDGPVAVYYSPYGPNDHEVADGTTQIVYPSQFYERGHCSRSKPGYLQAKRVAAGHPIGTLAGWSLGRIGLLYFLDEASIAELRQVNYGLLIDPGNYGELSCDRTIGGGGILARWLTVNPAAHLVVIAAEQARQQNFHGITATYFDPIRAASTSKRNLPARVLTCTYNIDHQAAFRMSKYWIRHQIGRTTRSCPWLNEHGRTYKPVGLGWHP